MDKSFSHFLLELLFPSFCLGCRQEGILLCGDCRHLLDISQYNYCLCGQKPLRLPFDAAEGKCSRCQDRKLAGLYFALPYQEKFLTRKLIHQFKYKPHIKELSKVLAEVLLEHFALTGSLTQEIWQNSILVAVPMEKSKHKERGYNQAEELAKQLGQALHVLTPADVLVKTNKTKPQMKLAAKERQENLKGVFMVKNPELIWNKKVFLVDDVYTTGSTMEECATQLLASGAKSVWGIAIAREG